LHRLASPAGQPSSCSLDRLAVLARSSPEILSRTLISTLASLTTVRTDPVLSTEENSQAQLTHQIQSDAEDRGLTIRSLAERHGVSRQTIRRALDAPRTPKHMLQRRYVQVIAPAKHLIDPLLESGRSNIEIWSHLVDEHDTVPSWSALACYTRAWKLSRNRPDPPLLPALAPS
jgi:lambda repressor-like predicted transcriptional regulator